MTFIRLRRTITTMFFKFKKPALPSEKEVIVRLPHASGYRDIWHLSWPQMLMMVGHFTLGFTEVAVAGGMGPNVQAAVGIMTQFLFFFAIMAVSLGSGVVAVLSQSLGMGLRERAQRYIWLTLGAGAALSLILTIAGLIFKDLILDFLNVPADSMGVAEDFAVIYLLLLPAHTIFFVGSAIFRSNRKVFIPLYGMIIVTAVGLGCIFTLGTGRWGYPGLGPSGLAWATFIAMHCGAIFILVAMRRNGLLDLRHTPSWPWIKNAWRYLFKVSWPSGMSQLLWQGAALVMLSIMGSLPYNPTAVLAGVAAGGRIESLLFLPTVAFNMSAAVVVGELLGAGKPEEAKKAGLRVLGLGCVVIVILSIILWIFSEPIIGLTTSDPLVQDQARTYLLYALIGMPFVLTCMIISGTLTGAGATAYSLVSFGLAAWAVRLPLAWLLGHVLIRSSQGVFTAMLTSFVLQAFFMLYLFKYGRWEKFSMRGGRRYARPQPTVELEKIPPQAHPD